MDKIYVCRTCGLSVREIELTDWSRHDFVNKDKVSPETIPEYDKNMDCETVELWEIQSMQ